MFVGERRWRERLFLQTKAHLANGAFVWQTEDSFCKRTADLAAVKSFLDVLHRAALRRKLEVLAGYDTSETGTHRGVG